MKKARFANGTLAVERAIAQALINARTTKTLDEKSLQIEIIELSERYSIKEVIQENLNIQDLLQEAICRKQTYHIFKIQSNFHTGFTNTLNFILKTASNLAFGLCSDGNSVCHFTENFGFVKMEVEDLTYQPRHSILTLIFSEDSTSFEELTDIITSYALLNSHLRYSIRWFEEVEFLKIISFQKILLFSIGRIASLTETLENSEESERLLHKILKECSNITKQTTHSTSVYFMSATALKECEVVMVSELNTVPELTMSKSFHFALDDEKKEIVTIDRLIGIRVKKIDKKSKAKNGFTIMVYSNGIPICLNESGAYHFNCFHHSLFKGFPQQVIQLMDARTLKTYFPNIGVSPNALKKDNFNPSTEHVTFEYDRYLDSQGTEIFLVINVSHNIDYLNPFNLENLKVNVTSAIAKDLTNYLEMSYQTLSKQEIFHSINHKKLMHLEAQSIPALASLLSDLIDEILIDDTLYEFAALPSENRVDLLKKSLTKICLLENALGGQK